MWVDQMFHIFTSSEDEDEDVSPALKRCCNHLCKFWSIPLAPAHDMIFEVTAIYNILNVNITVRMRMSIPLFDNYRAFSELSHFFRIAHDYYHYITGEWIPKTKAPQKQHSKKIAIWKNTTSHDISVLTNAWG